MSETVDEREMMESEREIEAIIEVSSKMAKRLGCVFVIDPEKVAAMRKQYEAVPSNPYLPEER